MRDCFTKIKTGMDYVQYLQSTRPAAIMTRLFLDMCHDHNGSSVTRH